MAGLLETSELKEKCSLRLFFLDLQTHWRHCDQRRHKRGELLNKLSRQSIAFCVQRLTRLWADQPREPARKNNSIGGINAEC